MPKSPRIRGDRFLSAGPAGPAEELARVVCFLAVGESAQIVGQIWAVNGGLDM